MKNYQDDDDREYLRVLLSISLGTLVFSVGAWCLFSILEARAFERVTGKHVAWYDALFVELKVQEKAR